MKKALLVVAVVILVTAVISSTALASGGKVRGENGQGDINQVQVMDPPPFQP